MLSFFVTSVSGWLLIVLLVAVVLYPFFLRMHLLGPVQPFLQRMRFHYWLGYSLAAVMLVHSMLPMMTNIIGSTNLVGLDLATGAFFLVFAQVTLGWNLSQPRFPFRRPARRWHFWIMVSIVALVLGHVALDSGTVQMLILR